MIELKNVTKRFGDTTAVDDISFTINKGEIVGFLGPNGAGKTTTMRILTGFFPPASGKVKIAGFDMLKDPLKAKASIGYMPENIPLYRELTVHDYLKFIADVKGVPRDKREAVINKAVDESGIGSVKEKIIGKLSKGYRQRVGIAQAVLNDPDILVLDEPTSGLDPKQIKEIRNTVKEMKGMRTIILSTHILPEVSVTCGKVIIINEGRVVAQDDVANLEGGSYKSPKIDVAVEAPKAKFISEIKKIRGVLNVSEEKNSDAKIHYFNIEAEENSDPGGEIVGRIVKNGWALQEFKKHHLTLEDVFLKLVTKEDA